MEKEDDKDKDKDNDEKDNKQDSEPANPNNEKQEQDSDTVKKEFDEALKLAFQALEEKKIKRDLKKPHLIVKFKASQQLPPQSYSLSDEEKKRILDRLESRVEAEVFPDPKPSKFFRPPKHPNPPVMILPEKPRKPSKIPRKIPDNWFDSEAKRLRKDEKYKDFKPVIDNPETVTIKELYHMIAIIKDKTIQGLEKRIYMVLHKCDDKDFKNYDQETREPKMSFYEWVQDCNDMEEFNAIKSRAVNSGYSISRGIVDIMFAMSHNKADEMGAKFQTLEETLSLVVSGEEDSVVICRILELLKAAELRLRRKKDSEIVAMEMQKLANGIKGKEVIAEEVKVQDSNPLKDLEESFIDSIMFQLLEEVFQAELFWVYKRLPCSRRLLIEAFPSLISELSRFEISLIDIQGQIEDSIFDDKFGVIPEDWRDDVDYLEIQLKIDQLWIALEQ